MRQQRFVGILSLLYIVAFLAKNKSECLQEEWGVLEKSPEAALDVDQTIFVAVLCSPLSLNFQLEVHEMSLRNYGEERPKDQKSLCFIESVPRRQCLITDATTSDFGGLSYQLAQSIIHKRASKEIGSSENVRTLNYLVEGKAPPVWASPEVNQRSSPPSLFFNGGESERSSCSPELVEFFSFVGEFVSTVKSAGELASAVRRTRQCRRI
ncbi:hypothetical protein YC2023_024007 [Brassica napus]